MFDLHRNNNSKQTKASLAENNELDEHVDQAEKEHEDGNLIDSVHHSQIQICLLSFKQVLRVQVIEQFLDHNSKTKLNENCSLLHSSHS